MTRTLAVLALVLGLGAGTAAAQGSGFPDTPPGRLAAAFFAAANSADEEALSRFQETNFTESALKRRSASERKALNRQLRADAGRLSLIAVQSSSATQLVARASGSATPGTTWRITFAFTAGPAPKIDSVQITPE